MALIAPLYFENMDLTVPNLYYRINYVLDRNGHEMEICYAVFKNRNAVPRRGELPSDPPKDPIFQETLRVPVDHPDFSQYFSENRLENAGNTLKRQAYKYIKDKIVPEAQDAGD